MLGADSLDHQIRLVRWFKKTKVDLFKHIARFYERGLKYVKPTNVSREASLKDPIEIMSRTPRRIFETSHIS